MLPGLSKRWEAGDGKHSSEAFQIPLQDSPSSPHCKHSSASAGYDAIKGSGCDAMHEKVIHIEMWDAMRHSSPGLQVQQFVQQSPACDTQLMHSS